MPLPEHLETEIIAAVSPLEGKLRCTPHEAETHRALTVEGWTDAHDTVRAVAVYLVGLLATAISRTLEVRAQVEDTPRDRLELVRNVDRITGTDEAPLNDDQKEDERNPWIAEGLWHLCLFLASRRADLHPLGTVVALDLPHITAKDHGLDVMAIYQSADAFGVSFVESKAYENDPNKAISKATAFFEDIDNGKHDQRIRQVVATMRASMLLAQQQAVSPSLWKDVRAYLPNPHYDSAKAMDWTNARPSFTKLRVPRDHIMIMPHAVPEFSRFFNDIATTMRRFAATL
jgi:hypothetical protein